MARAKKKQTAKQESIEDLAALAGSLNLVDDALDDELWDACESGARLQHETIKDAVMLDKIEFLYAHGYTLARIRELIEEAKV